MRHALRRILWIVPTLFLISIASFWLVSSRAGSEREQSEDTGEAHPFFGRHRSPRFLNRSPKSVKDLALATMTSIASDDARADAARRELTRLRGAALPYVLPALDSLDPTGRARVALA